MEEDGIRASMEGEGIASTDTNDFKAITSGSQPLLMQESLMGELSTPIPIVVHHAPAQSLEVLRDVSMNKNSRNDQFWRMKNKLDSQLEEANA